MAYTSPMKWTATIGAALALGLSSSAHANSSGSDRAAAIVSYPYVIVDSSRGIDTLVQLSTISSPAGVYARCVYKDATPHCASDGITPCLSAAACPPGDTCSTVLCAEHDFLIRLTVGQPIAWRASQGVLGGLPLPCTGATPVCGPTGQGNEGLIPPVPEDPFIGTLQCITVADGSGTPSDQNVLKGEATVEQYRSATPTQLDVAKYNAIGLQAIAGANNGDNTLILGGANAEYDACPGVNILNHFTENAVDPASGTSTLHTTLALMPCTQDLENQITPHVVITYSIRNEFEDQYSYSKAFDCAQSETLTGITAPITVFSFATLGTYTAQTRISSTSGGAVLGIAIEEHNQTNPGKPIARAAFNLQMQYDSDGDTITYPSSPEGGGGGTATATAVPTATPTPAPPAAVQNLADTVNELSLPAGITTALTSVLDATLTQINGGNTAAPCRQLSAFVNQVGAQRRAGRLSALQATDLTNRANAIRLELGC